VYKCIFLIKILDWSGLAQVAGDKILLVICIYEFLNKFLVGYLVGGAWFMNS